MSDEAKGKVPVTLICGFLGAGKTSWLNERIRAGIAADSLILVNDFGAINIDAELIEWRDERILRLQNGCICCTLGGTLAEQLAAIARWPAQPGHIYFEASGVARPRPLLDMLEVAPRFALAEQLCLVDLAASTHHAHDPLTHELWQAQIVESRKLLVNRAATLDAAERDARINRLRHMNPSAELNIEALSPHAPSAPRQQPEQASLERHGPMTSFSVTFNAPLERARLSGIIEAFTDVLVRAKGVIREAPDGRAWVMQYAGGQLRWLPSARPATASTLVCIGAGNARWRQLHAELVAFTDAPPTP